MPIAWTDDPAANQLLETDPLALLIGLVLDQQVKMEKAFGGPYELKRRLGHLDVRKIASMDPDKLNAVFRERPALHRFPGSMAGRVQALCKVIVEEYAGDAGSVWKQARDGDDLAVRIKKLPGFGDMKVKILVAIQAVRREARGLGEARCQLAHGRRR
jgi:uncharacterized HhH-GPD family protein